jgi:REP element-mobilizing transposase RayT
MKERKRNRKKGFDYASDGIYFLTICCKDRINYLGKINTRKMELNEFGNILNGQIEWMEQQYPYFIIHNYTIMPNHLHILAEISRDQGESSHPIEMDGTRIDGNAIGDSIDGDAIGDAIDGDAIGDAMDGDAMGDAIDGNAIGPAMDGNSIGDSIDGNAIGNAIDGNAIGNAIDGNAIGDAIGNAIDGNSIGASVRTGRDLSLPSPQKIKSISELMGALKTTSSKKIHLAGNLHFQWQRSFYDNIVKSENAYWNIYNYITQNPEKWEGDKFFNLD